jgi:hypothetical protein
MPNEWPHDRTVFEATGFDRPAGLLTVLAPAAEAGRSVAVGPRGVVLGRHQDCELALASDKVSRRHATVRARAGEYAAGGYAAGEYEVEDLGSKNGTRLNGERVVGARPVRDGDRLGVADVEIQFQLVGNSASPRASRPPAGPRWRPDRPTEAFDPDRPPGRSLRHDLQEAPGFSAGGLLLAVAGAVVSTVLTGAAGAGPWGRLAGAAVLPVVSAAFSTKRAGESGRVRTAAIALLSLGALAITWAGISVADLAANRSVIPGNRQAKTFPGPAPDHTTPSPTATASTGPPAVSVVTVSAVDCGPVEIGSSAHCAAVVTYHGDGRLRITRTELSGAHAGDFAAGADCVGERLGPGQTCEVGLTFAPTAAGRRDATLTVHQNLPPPDTGSTTSLVGVGQSAGSGPCVAGYVWREAVPGDHVCVLPQTHDQARRDNAEAGGHRSPTEPDACADGYVWREAVPGDHVCVLPETHDQAQRDNASADSHRAT